MKILVRLINFARRMYSGNGRLLQGDIYRRGVDGRAAWREIKSDCLGKSELPSTGRRARTPFGSGHLLPRGCRAAYQPRNEEHEEHTYRGISGPLSCPARFPVPRGRFNPFEAPHRGEPYYTTHSPPGQSISRTAIKLCNASSPEQK